MNYDDYGEVINGDQTYQAIAQTLLTEKSALVGWTDQQGTHFDVLFTLGAAKYGNNIQGGIRPETDLFVSIMRIGTFGFDPLETNTHSGYYNEKLGGHLGGSADKVAELINGVKTNLQGPIA